MFNNGYSSFIWHLFDYDHVPVGSWYGVKKSVCSYAMNCWNHTQNKPQLLYMPATMVVGAINHHGALRTAATEAYIGIYNVTGGLFYHQSVAVPAMDADSRVMIMDLKTSVNQACKQVNNMTLMIRLQLVCCVFESLGGGTIAERFIPYCPILLGG